MTGRKKTTSSKLKHRLTLQQEVRTDDGQGGYTRGWQDVADLWAEITPLQGSRNEMLTAGQLQASMLLRVLLRYRAGVAADMRLAFGSRILNIRSVINIGEDDETLEIIAEEGAGA